MASLELDFYNRDVGGVRIVLPDLIAPLGIRSAVVKIESIGRIVALIRRDFEFSGDHRGEAKIRLTAV